MSELEVTLRPTGRFEDVHGTRTRIWEGDYQGDKVIAYVAMIGIAESAPASSHMAFDRALREIKVERQLTHFDNRML